MSDGWGDSLTRLWAPHRLAYVTGDSDDEDGCPFCRIPAMSDQDGLVVARGDAVYAVLNKHPYNPGHLMVVTYRHVAELEQLTPEEQAGLADFTRRAVVALKRVAPPQGFNVGLNLGGVAGGSLASHLHQHVVPRWGGDANFLTVVGQAKVMVQLLSETRRLLADAWEADPTNASDR